MLDASKHRFAFILIFILKSQAQAKQSSIKKSQDLPKLFYNKFNLKLIQITNSKHHNFYRLFDFDFVFIGL